MKRNFCLKKCLMSSLFCLGISMAHVYSTKYAAENSEAYQEGMDQDWKSESMDEAFQITHPSGSKFTYFYTTTTCKELSEIELIMRTEKHAMTDSTESWACIKVSYNFPMELQGPLRDREISNFILANPHTQSYVALAEKPEIQNGYLVINPLTFVPQINEVNDNNDWFVHESSTLEEYYQSLIDSQQRVYSIRKVENKTSGDIIYSLHVKSPENSECINISKYLERDYGTTIKEINRKLHLEQDHPRQYILLNILDQMGEQIIFSIDVQNIQNKNTCENIFVKKNSEGL